MNGNKTFAERVKAQREKIGLSSTELATKLGIQKTRVSMWETNGTVPRQDMLFKVCDFLMSLRITFWAMTGQTVKIPKTQP